MSMISVAGTLKLRSVVEKMAPRHGFEPRFTAPKAAVLPLDDRGSEGRSWTFLV